MLGPFGTLNLAARSLSTQQLGTEVAGHNLANVNNPGYARQRLAIQTSFPVPTALGPEGTGAEGVAIRQIRSALLDRQVTAETSVRGWLEAQQEGLQLAQANLGEEIDRQTSGINGSTAAESGGSSHGIAQGLTDFFNAFQSLSTNPTSSAERQVLVIKAQDLAVQFSQVAGRLNSENTALNESLTNDVGQANQLIADIAKLNEQIVTSESSLGGVANDLRDARQAKIEELSKLVEITTTGQSNGAIDISIQGVAMTLGPQVLDQLETYDPGTGQLLVRSATSGTPLSLDSGRIGGTLELRDGFLGGLRGSLNQLASEFIGQVNALHRAGFDLESRTGEDFFTGTDAATIRVNDVIVNDPSRIQAAGAAGAPGDNQVALALAQLGGQKLAALGNQTFGQQYAQTVASLGQSLASINSQLDNQTVVDQMLLRQRDSLSGVSVDEEMTDLIKFQRAYEASARLITTLADMLQTLVDIKR